MGAQTIDSATITADPNKINYVFVSLKSFYPRPALHGYVSNNESTYSIIVNDDSATHYVKIYTITLQGDKKLSIQSFETDEHITGDTIINKCAFLGTKY